MIVPSLEGVGFCCSDRALSAFWDLLRKELTSCTGRGVNSLWTEDCENSQGFLVEGSWLLTRWGKSLDSAALAGLGPQLAPEEALDCFRGAVEKSNSGFCADLQDGIERFVKDLLLSQCTLHPSIDDLADQITALGAGAHQFIAPGSNRGKKLFDWKHRSKQMLTKTRSTLHNRLRRLGVNQASISLVQSSDMVFSSLPDKIGNGKLGSVTPEAVATAVRLKELHTFWINETGEITNFDPKKSSKGGGMWKRQFLNYVSNGSARYVKWGIESFYLSRHQK